MSSGQRLLRGVGLFGCVAACNVYTPALLSDDDDNRGPFSNGGTGVGGTGTQNGGFAGVVDPSGGAPYAGGTSGAGGTIGPGTGGTFIPGAGGLAGAATTGGTGGIGGDATAGSSGSTSAGGTSGGAGGAGAGGSSAGTGGSVTAYEPCVDPVAGTEEPFDDYEDEDEWLTAAGDRNGTWYVFNDGTVGTQTPAPMTTPLPVAMPNADVGAPTSAFVMHMSATGFTQWGSGIGANLVTPKAGYDAAAYQGITFWAKVGTGAHTKVRLVIPDATTEPAGQLCNNAANAPNLQKCNNHFFVEFNLTTSWRKCRIDFADLDQDPSWGLQAAALTAAEIYSVQFTVKQAVTADLWLDDLAFVLK